jgi:phospholipid-binding lipoprotein MlaA
LIGPVHLRAAAAIAVMVTLLRAGAAVAQAEPDEFNRWSLELNRAIAESVVRPGIERYERTVPDGIRIWVASAYRNLTEPVTATSHAIEGNVRAAASSSARFAVNSTLGVLGTFDFARAIGLPEREKGFSEAVCRSGLPLGAFLIIPVIGPTTIGIAVTAGTLMIGSTYLLSLASYQLAAASIAIDVIGSAAALENTIRGAHLESASYEEERARFIDRLGDSCCSRDVALQDPSEPVSHE